MDHFFLRNKKKRRKMRIEIATIAAAHAASNRGYIIPPSNQVNLRGRCAFGLPCDESKLSFGCEIFSNEDSSEKREFVGANVPAIYRVLAAMALLCMKDGATI